MGETGVWGVQELSAVSLQLLYKSKTTIKQKFDKQFKKSTIYNM